MVLIFTILNDMGDYMIISLPSRFGLTHALVRLALPRTLLLALRLVLER